MGCGCRVVCGPTVVRMQLKSASATSLHLAGSAERTSPVAAQHPSMATNSALHGDERRTAERSMRVTAGHSHAHFVGLTLTWAMWTIEE